MQKHFLILQIIAILVFVIVVGRLFELVLMTIFAPLPLATLASDVANDVGKSYLKNYIATVLQLPVIMGIFLTFVVVQDLVNKSSLPEIMNLIPLISLAMAVVKSGSWAKKICGCG